MNNTWKPYNKTDFKHLGSDIEVKTNDGKVHSISMIVGTTVFKGRDTEINVDEILFWRKKKDWNRFNTLQKHNQILVEFDEESLDDLEYAIYDSYENEEDKKKIEKLFKKLKRHIKVVEENIKKESKKYL